jgi:hypothetical protein
MKKSPTINELWQKNTNARQQMGLSLTISRGIPVEFACKRKRGMISPLQARYESLVTKITYSWDGIFPGAN